MVYNDDVEAVRREFDKFTKHVGNIEKEILDKDFPVILESYFSNNTVRYMFENGLNIQAGHVGVQIPSANSIGSANVTFNNVFAETPIVVGINQTNGPNVNNSGVRNISTTGFTAHVSGPTSGQTITFKWIAIGRTL